jgi:hypothetical protein
MYSQFWATWRQKVKADQHVNKYLRAESYSGSFQLRSHLEACLLPNFNNTLISTPKPPMFRFSRTFLARILHAHTILLVSFISVIYTVCLILLHLIT